jgi:glycosyltransferase involved in cell wall biosynthesis
MNSKPIFSIFSGCYNSALVIHRLFESIKTQTFRDFEWIIIDDASVDNTVELIEKFIEQNPTLTCKLIRHTTNTGIVKSREEALNMAKGEFFVKWDHDDIHTPDQLQVFYEMYTKYRDQNIGAVWCLCKDQYGKVVGNEFPQEETVSDYYKFYAGFIHSTKNKPRERHNTIKTRVHLEINKWLRDKGILQSGESPSATDIWCVLGILGYKTVFVNKPMRQYFMETGRARMSNDGVRVRTLQGYRLRQRWINYYIERFPLQSSILMLRLYPSLNMLAILSGQNFSGVLKGLNSGKKKFIAAFFYLPVLLYTKLKNI